MNSIPPHARRDLKSRTVLSLTCWVWLATAFRCTSAAACNPMAYPIAPPSGMLPTCSASAIFLVHTLL